MVWLWFGAFAGCQYLRAGGAPGCQGTALCTHMQELVDFGSPAKAGGPTGDPLFLSMGTSLVTEHNRAI